MTYAFTRVFPCVALRFSGPWAFPQAPHPTGQEPATHVTAGTGRTQPVAMSPASARPPRLAHSPRATSCRNGGSSCERSASAMLACDFFHVDCLVTLRRLGCAADDAMVLPSGDRGPGAADLRAAALPVRGPGGVLAGGGGDYVRRRAADPVRQRPVRRHQPCLPPNR